MMTKLLGLDHDLPADLRQSVGESALIKLALDAAQAVATDRSWPGDSRENGSSPQKLLALLTYCYAADTYGSSLLDLLGVEVPAEVDGLCSRAV